MATERLVPDAILLATNLSGTVSAIQDDPNTPDGSWLTAPSNNTDTELRVSFPTPTPNLTGTQTVNVLVRKTVGQSGTPQATVELWSNGVNIATLLSAVNVTGQQILSGTFNASQVSDPAAIEIYVFGTHAGGSPSARDTVEIGAIEINTNYTVPTSVNATTSDTISLSENINKIFIAGRTLGDTIVSSDALLRAKISVRSMIDNVVLSGGNALSFQSDTFQNDVFEAATGAVSDFIDYTISTITAILRSASDSVSGITDAVIRSAQIKVRSLTQALTISDALVRAAGVRNRTISATITTTDSIVRTAFNKVRTLADSIASSDSLLRSAMSKIRTIADTVIIGADTVIASIVFFIVRTVADTISTSDVVNRILTFGRSLADTINLTENSVRVVGAVRSVSDTLSEAVGAILRHVNAFRVSNDTLTLSEALNRSVSKLRSVVDTINITESVARIANKARNIADINTISDAATRINNKIRTAADTIIVGLDSMVRNAITYLRASVDGTVISDNLSRAVLTIGRIVADTISLTDVVVRTAISFTRASTDTLSAITDAAIYQILIGAQNLVRSASDTIHVGSDVITRLMTTIRATIDTTTISDITSRMSDIIRSGVDTIITSDTIARAVLMVRGILDTTIVTDTLSRAANKVRVALDTTLLSEGAQRALQRVVGAVDITGVSDSIIRVWSGTRNIVDTLPAIVDQVVNGLTRFLIRSATDTFEEQFDAVARRLNATRAALDTFSINDSIHKVGSHVRASMDSLSISDAVARLGVVVRLVAQDSIPFISDSIIAIKSLPAYVGQFIRNVFNNRIYHVSQHRPDRVNDNTNRVQVVDKSTKVRVRD